MRYKILIMGFVAVVTAAALTQIRADDDEDEFPSQEAIDFATETTVRLTDELFAALLNEFNATTPANAPNGIEAIQIIFNNGNDNMRLVGVNVPFDVDNIPRDPFEIEAHTKALVGEELQEVRRDGDDDDGQFFLRTSIPLSNFHANCVLCHTNFGPQDATQWVGALMLKVPINGSDDD